MQKNVLIPYKQLVDGMVESGHASFNGQNFNLNKWGKKKSTIRKIKTTKNSKIFLNLTDF